MTDNLGFSEMTDLELETALSELIDKEADDSERVARALERKNAPVDSVGGMLKHKIHQIQFVRKNIQHQETASALAEAMAEKEHRAAIKNSLPALVAELEQADRWTRERDVLAEQMQGHIDDMAATALALEATEDRLRRLETSIENREGGFRGVVRIGGTSFHPELLAKTFKTSMAMAFKTSTTYGRICRGQGLHSPDESQRNFATVIQQNGWRLLEKFRQEIDRIKTRKVA